MLQELYPKVYKLHELGIPKITFRLDNSLEEFMALRKAVVLTFMVCYRENVS